MSDVPPAQRTVPPSPSSLSSTFTGDLVSFTLFAGIGGGSRVVAVLALSARNYKLDAAGLLADSADVIFKFSFHYPSWRPVHVNVLTCWRLMELETGLYLHPGPSTRPLIVQSGCMTAGLPDNQTASGKLQTTSCTPACRWSTVVWLGVVDAAQQ